MYMKKKEVIEFIMNEMKNYPNIYFIDDCRFALRYFCGYCSVKNAGVKSIKDKYPKLELYISDGVLYFDYTYYDKE